MNCHHCEKPGHIARQCKSRHRNNTKRENNRHKLKGKERLVTVQKVFENESSSRTELLLAEVHQDWVHLVIDSGASEHLVISIGTFQTIGKIDAIQVYLDGKNTITSTRKQKMIVNLKTFFNPLLGVLYLRTEIEHSFSFRHG